MTQHKQEAQENVAQILLSNVMLVDGNNFQYKSPRFIIKYRVNVINHKFTAIKNLLVSRFLYR